VVAEVGFGHRLDGAVVLAGEGWPVALQHRQDDLQGLVELVEPLGEGAELEAERVVFEFEPARPDPEDRAALAHHVEGGDGLRQDRRVAVAVAGDQSPELHVLGDRRQCAECRVGLQHRLVRGAQHGQLIEVVHQEDAVEARLVGFLRLRDDSGEEFVDAGAVGDVRDLKRKSNRHSIDRSHG
jgi:hypothetical protein